MATTTVQCFESTTGFTAQIAAHINLSETGNYQPKAPNLCRLGCQTLKEDGTATIQLPTCD